MGNDQQRLRSRNELQTLMSGGADVAGRTGSSEHPLESTTYRIALNILGSFKPPCINEMASIINLDDWNQFNDDNDIRPRLEDFPPHTRPRMPRWDEDNLSAANFLADFLLNPAVLQQVNRLKMRCVVTIGSESDKNLLANVELSEGEERSSFNQVLTLLESGIGADVDVWFKNDAPWLPATRIWLYKQCIEIRETHQPLLDFHACRLSACGIDNSDSALNMFKVTFPSIVHDLINDYLVPSKEVRRTLERIVTYFDNTLNDSYVRLSNVWEEDNQPGNREENTTSILMSAVRQHDVESVLFLLKQFDSLDINRCYTYRRPEGGLVQMFVDQNGAALNTMSRGEFNAMSLAEIYVAHTKETLMERNNSVADHHGTKFEVIEDPIQPSERLSVQMKIVFDEIDEDIESGENEGDEKEGDENEGDSIRFGQAMVSVHQKMATHALEEMNNCLEIAAHLRVWGGVAQDHPFVEEEEEAVDEQNEEEEEEEL